MPCAKTSGDVPILALHVEHHHRVCPTEKIGNHNADALAGARRCLEQDMLGAAENEIAAAFLPDDDPTVAAQMFPPDLAFAREPCLAMERAPPLQDDEQDDKSDRAADQCTALKPQMKQRIAAVIPEPCGDRRDLHARANLVQADEGHQHRAQGACQKGRREHPRDNRDLSERSCVRQPDQNIPPRLRIFRRACGSGRRHRRACATAHGYRRGPDRARLRIP